MSTIDTRRALRRRAEAAHWLLKLREDPLPDAQMEAWLEWSSDPENLAEFETAQAIHAALRGVSPAAQIPARPNPRLLGKRRFLATAASVLLTVAAGLLYYLTSSTITATQTYSTGKAIHREIVLADGSQAILGAHSRLRVNYGPQTRRVTVEGGEAYFEVRKDSGRPFVVEAGKLSVTAVGTAFDVRRDDDRVVVTVGEGSVDVAGAADDAIAQLRARAGERVTARAGLPALTVAVVSPAAAGNWRHGALEFTGEPLHVVVANLNRYLANEITIRDAEIGQWIYSGTVQPARVDEWLSALAEVFPLHVAGGRALALRDTTPG